MKISIRGHKIQVQGLDRSQELRVFLKAQELNKKQVHWALYLLRFDFILKHILETKIEKMDRLSKRLDWKVRTENDNNNQTSQLRNNRFII